MKHAAYLVVLVMSVTAAFTLGTATSGVKASPGEAGRRIRYYVCPMHPESRSAHPGTTPCCGMRYEPVFEEAVATMGFGADSRRDAVHVAAPVRQALGLHVEEVRAAGGEHTIRLFGRVAPDEGRTYALNAGIDGTILELSAVTTGSRVRKGQMLGTYTAPELLLASQQYIMALDGLERRSKGELAGADMEHDGTPGIVTSTPAGLVINSGLSNLQQRVDRLRLLGMSERQMDEIRRVKDVPKSIKIFAPADGIVLSRRASVGRTFGRGEEWYRIADLRTVWVMADVFGSEADRVRPGMKARVSLGGTGRVLDASVSDVPPQYDPSTRTRTIRLDVDNAADVLRPDMLVDVELAAAFEPTVSVPADAVIENGRSRIVFVEGAPGAYEPRAVETGWRHDGRVQIVRGLTGGERIVRSGQFLLDSENRMRLAAAR